MLLNSFQIFLLLGGVSLSIFGGLVVFSQKFLHLLDDTLWKDSKLDKSLFQGKSGYWFNRYGRGLGALTLGLGMLFLLIQSFLEK